MTKDTSPPGNGKRRFPLARKFLAGAVASSLFIVPTTSAFALDTDDSEAMGQVISSDLLALELLDVATSVAGNPSDAGPNAEALNLSALDSVDLSVGTVQLPLITDGTAPGLLDLGDAGVLNSYASAPTVTQAVAGAGAVDQNGVIDVDGSGTEPRGNATVNLTDLLSQLGIDPLTDPAISNLELELGAFGSTATNNAGTITSEYVVADAEIAFESPAVGTMTTAVGTVVDELGVTIDDLVGADSPLLATISGILSNLNLAGIGLSNTVIVLEGADAALAGVTESLITQSFSDAGGIASIDLGTGIVSIDLAKAFDATNGLNGQDPNTDVINAATLAAITTALGEAIDDLTATLTQELKDAINSIRLIITSDVNAGLVTGTATINASIGQLLGTDTTAPVITADLTTALGGDIASVENALIAAVETTALPLIEVAAAEVFNPVLDGVGGSVTDAVTPLLTALTPVIDDVLAEIVQLTVNEQPTPGLLGAESFTVSALTLTLLPQAEAAKVSLATSTVRALDFVPVTIVSPTAGQDLGATGTVPVSGLGEPGATITVVLDGDAASPQTVVVDAEGNWTVTFGDVPAGDHAVVATQDVDGSTAEVAFTTAAPAAVVPVVIDSPTAGQDLGATGTVPVSGLGEPGATITVVLDGDAANPQTVVVDAEGNWTVTFEDVPAGDHAVVATQDVDGSTAEVAFTSTAADAADAADDGDAATAGAKPGNDLANTGASGILVTGGIALLLLIAGGIMVARRKTESL